jgi:aminoglycoside 6'-N-acetyltransferase
MMAARVTLRPARPDDAFLLERWDRDADVAAAQGADAAADKPGLDEDWRKEIAAAPGWRRILIGEEDGRPFGVIVDIDPAREETHYWGDCGPGLRAFDAWIGDAKDRGRGLGAAMIRAALNIAFADPAVSAVMIDPLVSNTRAIRFYQRCGFRALGERRFGDDDCLVMRFDRPD